MENDIEKIATEILNTSRIKPNYTNRDFMNIVIVFQSAMMDKLFDVMDFDGMKIEDRLLMAEKCGIDLKDFIFKYTNIDTHKIENYL
jgi:hypothetical protein